MDGLAELLGNNYGILLFVGLLLFLKPEKLENNQKLFFIYMFIYFIDFSNSIKTTQILIICLGSVFIYLEFLNNSIFKRDYFSKFRYRIYDFFYIMISQYELFPFLFLIFLNTSYFKGIISYSSFPSQIVVIYYFIQRCLACHISNSLYKMNWEVKELDDIKLKMDHTILINYLPKVSTDIYNLVVQLEDKSYYIRKTYSTFFTWETFKKYAIPKLKRKKNDFQIKSSNILKKKFIIIKRIYYSIISFFRRGHSTIEAQLIRSIGIKDGFDGKKINILKRKIFEFLYTDIIFNSMQKYFKEHYYENWWNMKEYILYLYLMSARIVILGYEFSGLSHLYGKNIEDLTEEEIFIGVLHFSKYNCNISNILFYAEFYNFELSKDCCEKVLKNIIEYHNLDTDIIFYFS